MKNIDALEGCVRFSAFIDQVERAHVSCIVAKSILDSRGRERDFSNWSRELFEAMAREYPNAVVTL